MRLKEHGLNSIAGTGQQGTVGLMLSQFKSPLVLILVFAAVVSAIAGEWPDALIVIGIVLGSTMLGFWQEYRATLAVEKLRTHVMLRSTVARMDSRSKPCPSQSCGRCGVVVCWQLDSR